MRCALLLLLAASAAAEGVTSTGLAPSGEPICKDGKWTETTQEALDSGAAVPQVQCWRETPCVQSHYMTFERCAAMKEEDDFPARDPLLFSSPGQRTMATLARGLLANKTVLFVGDSIMGQVFDAARCDLLRWGLHLKETREGVDLLAAGASAAASERAHAFVAATKLGTAGGYPCTGSKDSATGCVWFPDPPGAPWVVPETGTIVGFKGWHKFKAGDAAAWLAMADVVIVNYALHYHNMTEYAEDMAGLLHLLGTHAARRGKASIFRETTAQHFIGTGSFASIDQAHLQLGSRCSCGPMSDEVAASNDVVRLNSIVAEAAARHHAVRTLRMYDITVPRHKMHEESFCDYEAEADRRRKGAPPRPHSCCDCTHFCYTPQFWGAVWDRLASELEQTHVGQAPLHGHHAHSHQAVGQGGAA